MSITSSLHSFVKPRITHIFNKRTHLCSTETRATFSTIQLRSHYGDQSSSLERRRKSCSYRSYQPRRGTHDYQLYHQPHWQPAAEPGVDANADDFSISQSHKVSLRLLYIDAELTFNQKCGITAVDFSESHIEQNELTNDTLAAFLATPRPDWARCRWINVNGLSWDVVGMLGKHRNLHGLAIEDLLHLRTRTKVDWYTDHAFGMY